MMEACLASFQCLNARVVQKRLFFFLRGAGLNVKEYPVEMRAFKHSQRGGSPVYCSCKEDQSLMPDQFSNFRIQDYRVWQHKS